MDGRSLMMIDAQDATFMQKNLYKTPNEKLITYF